MIKTFLQKVDSTGYEVILCLILGNLTAQILKTFITAIQKRKFNFSVLFSTGGMPSSHSSTVTSMATAIGLIEGWDSTMFALAFCLAIVVMYDAAGVRRAASRQAWILNRIIKEIISEGHILKKERLKELLGHTPTEVLAGGILGVGVAFGLRHYIESLV
ncbi:MAG: divergent PAP2 family protein [Flavobacteriales bacterium]|nr:divergent PAP2 family protein [Flavobacteriales bacterium]